MFTPLKEKAYCPFRLESENGPEGGGGVTLLLQAAMQKARALKATAKQILRHTRIFGFP
jgi:hypothetical protein